ncbi:hypothetical protein AC578_7077 [Pseudocercospora eumusae]|uniref:MARVEL domain-containing protein n=1 Tax=Pseudocercospora eumusae TaxID=321146 RepID=A0A139GUS5_9PEZI|nr:hypothetical protein AC578_7077 [Pseudocercospora eumusae]
MSRITIALLAFACVILGLSIHFYQGILQAIFDCQDTVKHERPDIHNPAKRCRDPVQNYPSALFYSGFVGGFGLIDALIGLIFTGCLSFNVSLDVCALVFYLVAGTNFVVVYTRDWIGHGGCDAGQKSSPCSGFLGDLICLLLAFAFTVTAVALALSDERGECSYAADEGGPAQSQGRDHSA